jgi:hypothetical protein
MRLGDEIVGVRKRATSPGKSATSAVRRLFFRGQYRDVIERLGRSPLQGARARDWPLQIGALVFTGEVLEAKALFEAAEARAASLEADDLVQARFYLGVGLVRLSRYAEARRLFARNRLEAEGALATFFAWQGVAFIAFFRASFRVCGRRAARAYAAAVRAGLPYAQALAAELMGHVHCQLGEVHKGLAELDKARTRARSVGNGALDEAFQIAAGAFRSIYGHDRARVLRGLERGLARLAPHDTHSRAELGLELARQLVLRGRAADAKEALDRHCELVYRHQNRRQSAVLNLRYAHVFFLRGEVQGALTLLRSSRSNLDPSMDRLYLAQLAGLERRILGTPQPAGRGVNLVDTRIRRREGGSVGGPRLGSGEDPLGDLMDAVHAGRAGVLAEVLESGYLGLVPRALGYDSAESFAYLGPKRASLIVAARGEVHHSESLTAPMATLLRALEGGAYHTKEELVARVWGYDYVPSRHDALLQATLGKLRKAFGPFADWIEWGGGRYRLRPELRVLGPAETPARKPDAEPARPAALRVSVAPASTADLNHRQLRALDWIRERGFVGVQAYARRFKVCTMTACRDLGDLHRKGVLGRYGRARATHYGFRG